MKGEMGKATERRELCDQTLVKVVFEKVKCELQSFGVGCYVWHHLHQLQEMMNGWNVGDNGPP
jgi:hypothetical protein